MALATEAQLKELGLDGVDWCGDPVPDRPATSYECLCLAVLSNISAAGAKLIKTVKDFVYDDCMPTEVIMDAIHKEGEEKEWSRLKTYEAGLPAFYALQDKAKALGLWNLFLTGEEFHGKIEETSPISTLEYAIVAEFMGRSGLASAACNCAAPDTGNMEVIARFGNRAQKDKWLKPLMDYKIRSAFAMTEPGVASSDATNLATTIQKTADGKHYIINGRKWWTSNAAHPLCKIFVLVGRQTDRENEGRHGKHTVLLVPSDAPGVKIVRRLTVFGYDDHIGGHCEVLFEDVKVACEEALVHREGGGFEVLQGRLGPGRIHHCMRSIGVAEKALDMMLLEATNTRKRPFGKLKGEHDKVQRDIAYSRMELEQVRLLVLKAAATMDKVGPKAAQHDIAMAKIVVPNVVGQILDRAIQLHGGGGVAGPIAAMWAGIRTLRLADGPDEVHAPTVFKNEMRRMEKVRTTYEGIEKRAVDLGRRFNVNKL